MSHLSNPFGLLSQLAEIQKQVPKLNIVDTHARGDKKANGFGFEIKPDICIYSKPPNESVERHSNPIVHCDIAKLDLHVEFKWYKSVDPFLVFKPSDPRTGIVRDCDHARDTLGQISAYAAAQLSAQYRTHIFSLLIVQDSAYIIRWDREGAIVTEPIMYNDNPSLVEFLRRYSHWAPPELHGIDTTITPASEEEARPTRTKLVFR